MEHLVVAMITISLGFTFDLWYLTYLYLLLVLWTERTSGLCIWRATYAAVDISFEMHSEFRSEVKIRAVCKQRRQVVVSLLVFSFTKTSNIKYGIKKALISKLVSLNTVCVGLGFFLQFHWSNIYTFKDHITAISLLHCNFGKLEFSLLSQIWMIP